MPTPEELVAAEKLKAQVEWGTYVARGPIDIDGVRVFGAGHAVPVSHVTRFGLDDQVDKVETVKATKAAAEPKGN
jgi:hypothetical protein